MAAKFYIWIVVVIVQYMFVSLKSLTHTIWNISSANLRTNYIDTIELFLENIFPEFVFFKGVTKLPLSRLKSTRNKDSKKGFRFRVGRLQAEILKRLYFSPFVREKKLRRSHYALRIYSKHSKPSAPLNSACFGAW